MRTFTIKVKYNIGDKVWIMLNNYPVCLKITRIIIEGCDECEDGATPGFGATTYFLSNDRYKGYTEGELCDTFEELRDRVFSDNMRENVYKD